MSNIARMSYFLGMKWAKGWCYWVQANSY